MGSTPHLDRLTGNMPPLDKLQLRPDGFTIIDGEGKAYAHAARVNDEGGWVVGSGALTSSAFDGVVTEDRFRVVMHSTDVDDVQETAHQVAAAVVAYHKALDEADRLLAEAIGDAPRRVQGSAGMGSYLPSTHPASSGNTKVVRRGSDETADLVVRRGGDETVDLSEAR